MKPLSTEIATRRAEWILIDFEVKNLDELADLVRKGDVTFQQLLRYRNVGTTWLRWFVKTYDLHIQQEQYDEHSPRHLQIKPQQWSNYVI